MVPTYTNRTSVPGSTGMREIPLSMASSPLVGASEALAKGARALNVFAEQKQQREESAELLEVKTILAKGREENTLYMQNLQIQKGGANFTNDVTSQIDTWGGSNAPNFKTQKAQDAFNLGWTNLRSDLSVRANGVESKAFSNYQAQSVVEAIDADSSTVFLDPSQFNLVLSDRLKEIDAMPLDGNQKDKMSKSAKSRLAVSQVQGLLSSDPEATKADLASGRWKDYLSGKQTKTLLSEAETGIKKEKSEAAVAQSMAYSDLVIKILDGTAGQAEIDAFEKSARLDIAVTGRQFIALKRITLAQEKQERSRAEDEQLILDKLQMGAAAYNGNVALSQDDKTHRDIIDYHYDSVSRGWTTTGKTSEQIVDLSVDYIKRTGIVPQVMETNIVAGLNSTDDSKVIASAMMLEKLTSAHNRVINQFADKSISFGEQVLQYNREGRSPQDAVKLANEMRDVPSGEKDSRIRQMSIVEKDTPSRDVIQKRINDGWFEGGFFESDPVIDEVITAEFSQIREREYIRTGNDDVAQKAAFTMLKKNWGVTGVDGRNRFMRKAPELFYGQANLTTKENTEWMRNQLISDYSKNAILPEGFEENLILTVNPNRTTRDGLPVYMALSKDPETGIISETGLNAWVPDYSLTPEFEKINEEKAQEIEDAQYRRKQEILLDKGNYEGPISVPELGGGRLFR
tara:strand:+ start:328 stop:2385 length:2058 start_codon:yes stop_codon:yes gene_type:complete